MPRLTLGDFAASRNPHSTFFVGSRVHGFMGSWLCGFVGFVVSWLQVIVVVVSATCCCSTTNVVLQPDAIPVSIIDGIIGTHTAS